jgi:Fe-S cluster biosynthesis and repair protein YggX
MTRTVFCRKYKTELEGLDRPPYPGEKGADIYQHVSKKAWQEWMAHQTTLINEKRLNVMDVGTKVYLNEQMQKFFSGDIVDVAEGYVSPEEKKST